MSGPYECERWPQCSHPCLRDGEVIVQAARIAELEARVRMHGVANHGATYWKPTDDGHMGDWQDCPHGVCAADRAALAPGTGEAG